MNKYYFALGALGFAILLAIIGGFSIVGSPITKKAQALDKQRINDFTQIKYAIDNYYLKHNLLPKSLDDVKNENTSYTPINTEDPETKKIYKYQAKSLISYELCTEFSTDTKINSSADRTTPTFSTFETPTEHSKGYQCISYTTYSSAYGPTPTPYCQDFEKLGTITYVLDSQINVEVKENGTSNTYAVTSNSATHSLENFKINEQVKILLTNCKFTLVKITATNTLSPTPSCENYTILGKVVSDQGTYISINYDSTTPSGQSFLNAGRGFTDTTLVGKPTTGDRVQVTANSCKYTITTL